MPIYTYLCTACLHEFDDYTSRVRDKHYRPPCPCCGYPTDLVLYPPALEFKGTGWATPKTEPELKDS